MSSAYKLVSGKLMKQIFIFSIFLFGLFSCGQLEKGDLIDFGKTEKLIPLLNRFNFSKIELTGEIMTINDTLIQFDTDTSKNIGFWVEDSISAIEWAQRQHLQLDSLIGLKKQIQESKNYRIVKEGDAYFFSEGGWIDSNYGKAYSKTNISKDKAKFKFDRVQNINAIKGRPDWYEYYAD